MNKQAAIRAVDLSLSRSVGLWRRQQILQGVDFELPEGAVMGLVGRNGAGKSSLLRCLLGLTLPERGHAELLGRNSAELGDAQRERLGYVAQTPDLFGWLTGLEHLRELSALYPSFDSRRALAIAVQLQAPMGLRASHLSVGEQQKLAVVLALAHDPDLLVMDEPVAALDPLARRDFMRALFAERSAERAERPRSVLISSHLLGDLERVVSHVLFLREGRVQLVDTWDALVEHLRLLKLDALPSPQQTGIVHSRRVGERLHVLADLRQADSGWCAQGQPLSMDDLFEELNG